MHDFGRFHVAFFIFLSAITGWGIFTAAVHGLNSLALSTYSGASSVAQVQFTLPPPPTPSPTPAQPTTLKIMIAGDVMTDRKVRLLAEKNGYDSLFTNIGALFQNADIAIANLEGPITTYASKTLLPNKTTTNNFAFTFDPKTADALKAANFTAVNLANNHSDNFGPKGLAETRDYLTKADVAYFGDPSNTGSTESTITKNGMTVAFVGYSAFHGGFDTMVADVKRLSSAGDFVVVMPHWGDEYKTQSTTDLKTKARALVAAGAGAIVGSHPHVIMDYEWMGGVPVFYSVGNLLFDQYFSADVMKGEVVELDLTKKGTSPATVTGVDVYTTSLASKKTVDIDMTPVIIPVPGALSTH